ncbi:MAG: transglutaminase family protein [Verrucomicrobiota bacterium]
MEFAIYSSLHYEVIGPAHFLFALSCLKSDGQKVIEERFSTSTKDEVEELSVGTSHNRFNKVFIETPGDFSVDYRARVEVEPGMVAVNDLADTEMHGMDGSELAFLFPSRYAQTDLLRGAAWDLFGIYEDPHKLALAIEDWLFEHIDYQYGSSNEQSSALETFATRSGVCRDFAHLGIAFCRALNLPARYVTVYAHGLEPQDFHAVFEVYLGDRWVVMDGTRKVPLNGLVRIATGRDAGDVAMATLFGHVIGTGIQVTVDELPGEGVEFCPLFRDVLREEGLLVELR